MKSHKKVDTEHIYGGRYHAHTITYQKPSYQIVIAMVDWQCPKCGIIVRKDAQRILMGLDLGIENGKIYGGICFNCGWSF